MAPQLVLPPGAMLRIKEIHDTKFAVGNNLWAPGQARQAGCRRCRRRRHHHRHCSADAHDYGEDDWCWCVAPGCFTGRLEPRAMIAEVVLVQGASKRLLAIDLRVEYAAPAPFGKSGKPENPERSENPKKSRKQQKIQKN